MNCYCGSLLKFENCCLPFIEQKSLPQTAEQLMRSRYSAFCANRADYLVATHWPIDLASKATIQATIDSTQWLGLKVVASHKGLATDQQGEVEFIAFFNEQGIQQLHERSRFSKYEARWFYIDGDALPAIKIGRNDACFCASGRKFKRCHGRH